MYAHVWQLWHSPASCAPPPLHCAPQHTPPHHYPPPPIQRAVSYHLGRNEDKKKIDLTAPLLFDIGVDEKGSTKRVLEFTDALLVKTLIPLKYQVAAAAVCVVVVVVVGWELAGGTGQ